MTNANLFSLALVSFLSFSICNASRRLADVEQQFGYTAGAPNEPTKWGSLRADWKTCETGETQSPINLDEMQTEPVPADLKIAYKDAPAKLVNEGFDINIEWQGDAGGIELKGINYKLVHSHWHIPSEHTIDGLTFDAELHLVHSNAKEELVVVALLYKIGDEPDYLIQTLEENMMTLSATTKTVDAGTISASSLKYGSSKFFRYMGSLTTPPCVEGVTWIVSMKAKTISEGQIQMMKDLVQPGFKENARPTQDLKNRKVNSFAFPEEQ